MKKKNSFERLNWTYRKNRFEQDGDATHRGPGPHPCRHNVGKTDKKGF